MRRRRWPTPRATSDFRKPWRSGLEEKIAADLTERGVRFYFEDTQITYRVPESYHKYTPDFRLDNGIYVESKGFFDSDDRKKHLFIKAELPHVDIRFVFQRANSPIRKGSKTTYADWCQKHGFRWAEKWIPQEWIDENPRAN